MKKNTLKKLFCVILAVAVFAVSIPFTAIAANPSEVNFAIISDPHYFASTAMGYSDADRKEFREMMYLNNSTSGIAPELTEAAMANVTAMALAGQLDFLLLPGDLTRNAEYSAHIELAEMLKKFEMTTGVPVYVINGNHDINNQRAMYYNGQETVSVKDAPEMRDQLDTTPEEFEAIYADFGYTAEGGYYNRYKAHAENSEGSLSYAIDINDDYRLIAIDSQLYSADATDSGENEQETAGYVTEAHLEWVLSECAKAKADGKTIIGMTHTNAIPHFETEVDLFDNFVLRSWEKFADAVADAGMHYIVSGHVHMQDIATYVSDNGESITDIVTTSLLSYPNQFRTVSLETGVAGNTSLTYDTHDVDEYVSVIIDGVPQAKPFKYQTWAYNFGGTNIKNFVFNILEYELTYGFGKDVKNAGGLYYYLEQTIGIKELIGGLVDNETIGSVLGGLGEAAVRAILFSLCNQVDRAYLQDPAKTLEILDPILDKLLSIEVSDYPSTAFKDTLGFGGTGEKGTLGELASSVLAYHYTNNEDPDNDKFLQSALDRFYNGENAEVIVDTLLDVVLNDLLQDTILKDIKIDPVSWGVNSEMGDLVASLTSILDGILGTNGFPEIGVSDIISVVLITGILGDGDKLSDVVYGLLDEYLTESQYDIIDGEFYRIMKDLTHDNDPAYMADFEGTVNYNGKVAVPLSQDNMRLPSHIAVTFGEDAATSRNINYFTKYSLTDTDIQIVPYSENPDFSKGSTVKANIDTNCEIDAEREYYAIDLGFIGIITHKMQVNRHTIEITGLEEGTKYCYRVGDAERGWWSDIGVIDTADNTNAFSFFHMTDPQSVTEKQYAENWAVALDTAFTNHNDADFILNTGDLVDNGNDFVEWKRMFNTAADTLMDTVMMAASGNHEERGDNAQVNNFVYSNLPEQDTTTGVYYSFDYNTAHVAVLNSNDLNDEGGLSDAQIQWLTEDMNASEKAWKFVALHKAPYSNGSHFDDEDVAAIRTQLATLMPELDIDVVFQGHDHVYMRTDVMNNNAVVETETQTLKYNGLEYVSKISPEGTIYSINGTAGSKHYEPKAEEETSGTFPAGETVVSINVPSYSYIQIDGGNLYFDSYAVNGDGSEERIDSFAISKVVTLEDGTIIDGTNGNATDESNKNDNVIGDITDTFRQNPVFSYVTVAGIALVLIAGVVVTTIIIKRRREEA
ncbi:MAG: metallophosphoesterase [Clostridia bacterium]|nr:metallophosphoesterase [Clostridia bacterium]